MPPIFQDLDVLTDREREALRIAAEPRCVRGAIYAALGTNRRSQGKALARARRKLAQAARARLLAA